MIQPPKLNNERRVIPFMSDGVHLLIPFAAASAEGCTQAMRALALPQLEQLLARLAPLAADSGDENALSMPHERVLARECGLSAPDGRIAWAAWQVEQAGRDSGGAAWAWITPCHWLVGTGHVAMSPPDDLRLEESESRALLATMLPFFEQDGITLEYSAPTLWLARGAVFAELATASLDRVIGRAIDDWMPRAPQSNTVRRLQQEMQMLLYTHEITESRLRAGLLPVNSFWVSGTGALPASRAKGPPPGLQIDRSLREFALRGDWPGWACAWQALDAGECARLRQSLDDGRPVTVSLCGERNAQTWSNPGRRAWWRSVGARFARNDAAALLATL